VDFVAASNRAAAAAAAAMQTSPSSQLQFYGPLGLSSFALSPPMLHAVAVKDEI
jgi:hypothetical protein